MVLLCVLQGGRLVGMDDVNAAVEEHQEQGRMSKWWNGITQSKSGQAFGNHSAVKALTYVRGLLPHPTPGLVGANAARVKGRQGAQQYVLCAASPSAGTSDDCLPCLVCEYLVAPGCCMQTYPAISNGPKA